MKYRFGFMGPNRTKVVRCFAQVTYKGLLRDGWLGVRAKHLKSDCNYLPLHYVLTPNSIRFTVTAHRANFSDRKRKGMIISGGFSRTHFYAGTKALGVLGPIRYQWSSLVVQFFNASCQKI